MISGGRMSGVTAAISTKRRTLTGWRGTAYYPDKHGFDLNIAGTSAANPSSYFAPYNIATLPEGPTGEYLTDRLGDEAVRFIEKHKDQPFFLYLPHFAVHLPVQGKAAL